LPLKLRTEVATEALHYRSDDLDPAAASVLATAALTGFHDRGNISEEITKQRSTTYNSKVLKLAHSSGPDSEVPLIDSEFIQN